MVLDRAGGVGFLGDSALGVVDGGVRIGHRGTNVLLLDDSAEGIVGDHQSLGGGPRAIVVGDRIVKELLLKSPANSQ